MFAKKCNNCNGIGHVENLLDYQNTKLGINSSTKKSSKSNNTKFPESEPLPIIEKQEKIFEKEPANNKSLNKDDDHSNKKENDNEMTTINNPKEKKVITVELNNDEKIVYSQLGINPLIKLGREYLTSNNLIHLEDEDNKEKETTLKNNKKSKIKVSNSKSDQKLSPHNSEDDKELNDHIEANSKNKSSKIKSDNDEIELTEEIDNTRRKRRRSSASIE